MRQPVTEPTIFPATTRVAVLEMSEFFTYRQLSEIIGRDQTTIRQWPDRAREAPEPYVSRLMLTYEIVCQLLWWSRTPDITGYFLTPYNGRTVTQALHDWTRVDKYDDLLEVIADGPQAMIDALEPSPRPRGPREPASSTPASDREDGLRLADALASKATVQGDGTIVSNSTIIGVLRNDRALLDPKWTMRLLDAAPEQSEADRRARCARALISLGWLQLTANGSSTRPFRLDGKVKRVWDLPSELVTGAVRGRDVRTPGETTSRHT